MFGPKKDTYSRLEYRQAETINAIIGVVIGLVLGLLIGRAGL